jgi:hypothetical protein
MLRELFLKGKSVICDNCDDGVTARRCHGTFASYCLFWFSPIFASRDNSVRNSSVSYQSAVIVIRIRNFLVFYRKDSRHFHRRVKVEKFNLLLYLIAKWRERRFWFGFFKWEAWHLRFKVNHGKFLNGFCVSDERKLFWVREECDVLSLLIVWTATVFECIKAAWKGFKMKKDTSFSLYQ